jgi:hypothetical protein
MHSQIYDETLAMLSDAMHQALSGQSWLNQLLAQEANRKVNSVEAWLELQPKFKVMKTTTEGNETYTKDVPSEGVSCDTECDELATQIQPITVKLIDAKIDAELHILEGVSDWVKQRPKLKIPKGIKLTPAEIDAELMLLEEIQEYIRHQPKLKVRQHQVNYEDMFVQKTGLGQERYEEMRETWQDIAWMMQDFTYCWKRNKCRGSQALDRKGNDIEIGWRNFKARFKISFDQDLEKAIRDYTPGNDATS